MGGTADERDGSSEAKDTGPFYFRRRPITLLIYFEYQLPVPNATCGCFAELLSFTLAEPLVVFNVFSAENVRFGWTTIKNAGPVSSAPNFVFTESYHPVVVISLFLQLVALCVPDPNVVLPQLP